MYVKNIVGCAASAPDSSSPRGYSRIFLGIDLKNEFFFFDSSISFITVFRRLPWSSPIRKMSYQTFAEFFLLVSTTVTFLLSRNSNSRDIINTITLYVILTWRWPLFVGSAVILQFSCPLVGCRFRSLRHVSAHVPSSGSYIRGVGKFTVYQFLASATATIVAHLAPLRASA